MKVKNLQILRAREKGGGHAQMEQKTYRSAHI